MRVVFMGSPEFSVPTLNALADSEHDIVAVYSQPPRPAGRGKHERPTAVHARALELGLDVRTPRNFKDPSEVAAFADLKADIAVVIAYGLILPQPLLDAPGLGAVNLHASLLPRWRGAAPIHRAIMAGDTETGVALMQMEAGLDTGPVYTSRCVPIADDTTTGMLHDRLAALSADILINNIDKIAKLVATPQHHADAIYAPKITKDEAQINWSNDAHVILRQIHGLAPFPGAWSTLDGERIKFHRVQQVEGSGAAGTILDDRLTIACGTGAIRPMLIQREGRKAVDIDAALNGFGNIQGKSFI